ncbi:MAG: LEA type 2 family protein [Candidatus Woesearchaeota archaeon]
MKKKKRWLIPVIILVLLTAAVLGYVGYYFYSFTQLQIANVGLSSLDEFSLKSVSFSGYIDVNNPNLISVKIDRVEYGVVFEPTGQLLTTGILEGRKLPSKQITRMPFHENISWAPAIALLVRLVKEKEEPINIVITGNVYVTEKIKLPFVYKIDIREYFKKYVEEYLASQKEQVVEKVTETIGEKYGKIAGEIAERIAGFLT